MTHKRNNRKHSSNPAGQESAKKSLGQHFLSDPNILEKIAHAGAVTKEDVVLEIGPGRGALTRTLLDTGARVIVVEKDKDLIPHLNSIFTDEIESQQLSIIEGDVLDSRDTLTQQLEQQDYKVVANIPYYITGKILRFLFSLETLPETVVLLVQDEVARRIVSDKESILSLSVKAFGTPHYRGKVKAGSFSPPPKVDSAILSIEDVSRNFFDSVPEELFFKTVRKAFSQKRKTLLNTLFVEDKHRGREVLEELNLKESVRPQEIHLKDWQRLVYFLHEPKE